MCRKVLVVHDLRLAVWKGGESARARFNACAGQAKGGCAADNFHRDLRRPPKKTELIRELRYPLCCVRRPAR